ncbi:hypothetical protein ACP70R_046019 [Stipagrostis hirtigluma subsp. patula]
MAAPEQLVLAASSADAGVAAWDLRTGGVRTATTPAPPAPARSSPSPTASSPPLRSPPAAATPASSTSTTGPQVAVKSFPAEPIHALIADPEGSYLIGGGSNGNIFLWEVASGQLLHTWHGHYRAVRCFALYDYWLVSGSEDGSIRVWDLITMLDEQSRLNAKTLYMYNFSQHALPVTDVACFLGGIAVSSSEDRTCKIWSLPQGRMLRSISFPVSIDSVALDSRGHIFYAGGRDGKIYVAAMGVDGSTDGSDDILGALDDHSKAVTSLASSTDGLLLVSGSEDGNVRVWDTRSQQVIRKIKHSQGPVTNVLIVTPKNVNLPPLQPLRKVCAENVEPQSVILPRSESDVPTLGYKTCAYAERVLDAIQMHGDSSILFGGAGGPNQQGTDWRSRYLELQDLFAGEVLDQLPSSRSN